MRIYIVRHGQSTSNVMKNHLGGDSQLTALGIQQSKKIAARVSRLTFDVIISSDFVRALQTAEIICKRSPKKLITTSLLQEERHPSEMVGQPLNNPEVTRIKKLLYKNRNRRWHFSDEENFFDLKKRMEKCASFLEKRKEENILVVGHTFSTRMLIAVMIFGDDLTPDLFQKMRDGFMLRNTGITVCDFVDGHWKLVTWNDHVHLG